MIDTSVLLTDVIVDASLTEAGTSMPQADNSISSFFPDYTNMGYFWAVPSDVFWLISSGIFQASIDVVDTGDSSNSMQQQDILGAPFGGISDPGAPLALGLTNTPINTSTWSGENALTFVSTTSVQYWS